MNTDIWDDIQDAIEDRNEWSVRMDGFYRMRFKGIGRLSKPYPGAPDMKYGLPDALIEKLKALYTQQIYANENLATFVSTKRQDAEATAAAESWFDYQLRQKSNFERMNMVAVDKMLECGFVPVKIFWNDQLKQVCFDTIDPLNVIVPKHTEELSDADFLVHVMPMSVAQYRRNPNYNQNDDFIKRIRGRGLDSATDSQKEQSKDQREGLTCGRNDNEIVLWEIYHPDGPDENANIVVDTIAPVLGWDKDMPVADQVRGTFGIPYKPARIPFIKLRMEVVDKGWYSSRGVVELIAPNEQALCKTWNAKLQYLDFFGNPTYQSDPSNPLPTSTNISTKPGAILPAGLVPTQMHSAPLDFEQEMQFTRALAEDRIAVPDLNASEHLSGNRGASGGTTATQINAIVGQSGQSNDLRARIFRLDMAQMYQHAWYILLQYAKDEVNFLLANAVKEVPPEALHTKYIIQPNGSSDSWNKQGKAQVALALYQTVMQSPFGNKAEALKWLIEETSDPQLIQRLFLDPNKELSQQAEQQAQEISIMLLGYPAAVEESDDDKTHLQTLTQFVERRLQQNEPITPEFAQLALEHGGQHMQALQQKKDPALAQITQATMPVVQILTQLIQQGQSPNQMSPGAGGVPPPQGGGPAPATPGPSAPPPDPNKDAQTSIAAGNMLVNAAKAGMPVDAEQMDVVLQRLQLPPMTVNQHLSLAVTPPPGLKPPPPPAPQLTSPGNGVNPHVGRP